MPGSPRIRARCVALCSAGRNARLAKDPSSLCLRSSCRSQCPARLVHSFGQPSKWVSSGTDVLQGTARSSRGEPFENSGSAPGDSRPPERALGKFPGVSPLENSGSAPE
eukprot:3287175-Alexandrium_andersonii.AAC.1